MNENKNNDNNGNNTPNKNNSDIINFLILGIIFTISINLIINFLGNMKIKVPYNEFMNLVETNNVQSVEIGTRDILIVLKDNYNKDELKEIFKNDNVKNNFDTIFKEKPELYTSIVPYDELVSFLHANNVEFYSVLPNALTNFISLWVIPLLIFWIAFKIFSSKIINSAGSGIGSIGKSSAKIYNKETKTGVTFKDVAGLDEAKESLEEIVDFLDNPKKYTEVGAKLPKGALLVGPPGTGKTLIAKAVAGEASVPFFSLSGSEFVEMFVGVGAKRVRDLFEQANKSAPCIVFIDEIDAIGKKRDDRMGSNDEREQTLNQLLTEMDGFDSSKGIIILAATNRPEILDKALLRPGRIDRRVIVDLPDLIGREEILKVHSAKVKMDSKVDYKQIALATSGASGADLANMVNEAALSAVRAGRTEVKQEDLMESVEIVIVGKEKKNKVLSEKEKRIVSYHEVGHALASALQKDAQPVQKITIIPRTMGSLGYVMTMPEDERNLESKEELLAKIVMTLAGRAAEEIIFKTSTSGAANDIQEATKIARHMITVYGMSEKFDMVALEDVQNRYLDGKLVANYSEPTGAEIDKEVLQIIKESHVKARNLLEGNVDILHEIAEFLIKKETITGEEFMEIFRRLKDGKVEIETEE